MTVMRFMVMSAEQADEITQASAGRDYNLRPRLVDAGSQAGRYALLSKLKVDDRYSDFWPMMAAYEEMDLDTDEMWPPEPEEEPEA